MSDRTTHLLLVDDDDVFRTVMASELQSRGFDVSTAGDGREALERSVERDVDVIVLDLRLPDADGIDLLAQFRERGVTAGVVVLTGHGTIDTAIQAIRLGAHDYLEKPCPVEKLEVTVQRTAEHRRLLRRQRILEDGYAVPKVQDGLVGSSPAFDKLVRDVTRIAHTESTTLIRGETGVGKEMIAKLLHARSPRHDAPFVVVDCASLHEELLQSELFGHERGAFTGADRQKHGLFEVAHGGTLFLDEVGDTSSEIQAKLLRVLETGRFRRVGGTEEIAVDVRVVSATNRDLEQAIGKERFREDLYYRLATLTVEIPPLRERHEDIRELTEHFSRRLNARYGTRRTFSPQAMQSLLAYSWPGNVRELLHVVEQCMVLAEHDVIDVDDLPVALVDSGPREARAAAPEEALPLREVERRHVLAVVEQVGGNRARAARILQISERNLYRLLHKYGHNGVPQGSAEH